MQCLNTYPAPADCASWFANRIRPFAVSQGVALSKLPDNSSVETVPVATIPVGRYVETNLEDALRSEMAFWWVFIHPSKSTEWVWGIYLRQPCAGVSDGLLYS